MTPQRSSSEECLHRWRWMHKGRKWRSPRFRQNTILSVRAAWKVPTVALRVHCIGYQQITGVKAEVREYDRSLYGRKNPSADERDFTSCSTQTASTTILTAMLRNMQPTRSQVNISSSSVFVISH